MDLQGDLAHFSLPEIFQLVSQSRKTGCLEIQSADNIAQVYLRDGNIYFATATHKKKRFGEILLESGKVSPKQLEEILQLQKTEGQPKRLGAILVEQGILQEDGLRRIVEQQIEELIYEILAWSQGHFRFDESPTPEIQEVSISISTENLILEGMRRLDEFTRIQESLPSFDTRFELVSATEERVKDIALKPDEWNTLRLVNGLRSIDNILVRSPLDRFQTCKNLSTLLMAGLIQPVGKDQQKEGDNERAGFEDLLQRLLLLVGDRYGIETSLNRILDQEFERLEQNYSQESEFLIVTLLYYLRSIGKDSAGYFKRLQNIKAKKVVG